MGVCCAAGEGRRRAGGRRRESGAGYAGEGPPRLHDRHLRRRGRGGAAAAAAVHAVERVAIVAGGSPGRAGPAVQLQAVEAEGVALKQAVEGGRRLLGGGAGLRLRGAAGCASAGPRTRAGSIIGGIMMIEGTKRTCATAKAASITP